VRLAGLLRWCLTALALAFLAIAGWVRFRFGTVSLEQILLNLPTGGSEGTGNGDLVAEGLGVGVGLPLVVTAVAFVVTTILRRGRPPRPAKRPWAVPLLAFATSLVVFLSVAGVPEYAVALLLNRSIAPYYLAPQVSQSSQRPRNLVTIYFESGENTYADPSVFGENLLADLDAATSGWSRFDGLRQYPGGGWTMSGLVSTQCGIPLKSRALTDGMNLNNLGEEVASYLPGATCLGDVLSAHGYTNVFLGGANARFAGKDTFLAGHGYDRVLGLTSWESAGEARSQVSVWGLSDRRLFAHASQEFDDLRAGGKPFNLTMLTLDTHEPAGVFPGCSTPDAVAMKTAITCSSRAVAGFLEHVRDSGALQDTVVVVMGDHLKATSEGGAFKAELEAIPDRTIVYRVWSPDGVTFSRDRADQLSVLPTTLELLGFDLPDGRAGLGVSFVEPHPLTGTALALSDDDYRTVVTSPSSGLYKEFWGGQEPEMAVAPPPPRASRAAGSAPARSGSHSRTGETTPVAVDVQGVGALGLPRPRVVPERDVPGPDGSGDQAAVGGTPVEHAAEHDVVAAGTLDPGDLGLVEQAERRDRVQRVQPARERRAQGHGVGHPADPVDAGLCGRAVLRPRDHRRRHPTAVRVAGDQFQQ
jgi:phosphoglycerol transferase